MRNYKTIDCDNHHAIKPCQHLLLQRQNQRYSHSLQYNERRLIMYQWPRISTAQLINTIRAPYQDEQDRQGQEGAEDLEPIRDRRGSVGNLSSLDVSRCVFDDQCNEDAERKNLKGQTGDGDVDSDFGSSRCSGREATTDGLQAE